VPGVVCCGEIWEREEILSAEHEVWVGWLALVVGVVCGLESGPRPTSVPSGILIHPAIWPQQTWAENWESVPLWGRGSWVPIQHNVAWAETYLHAKLHLDPSNRLATVHQR